jgi:hypothetical protein
MFDSLPELWLWTPRFGLKVLAFEFMEQFGVTHSFSTIYFLIFFFILQNTSY